MRRCSLRLELDVDVIATLRNEINCAVLRGFEEILSFCEPPYYLP